VSSSGQYTAPYAYGVDTILVTDDNGDTETVAINVLPPLQLLAQIIQQRMGLANGRVWIWDQKINAPKDDDIFITLRELSSTPYASNQYQDDDTQVFTVSTQAQVQIDIESGDQSAQNRKEEIIMAMKSQYSQNQQTLNSFKIADLPSVFANVSELQGTKIPYRFSITFNFLYLKKIVDSPIDYYDGFEISVDTNTEQSKSIELEA